MTMDKMEYLGNKQEDIKAYLIIINLLLLVFIFSYILYLMWTYKW